MPIRFQQSPTVMGAVARGGFKPACESLISPCSLFHGRPLRAAAEYSSHGCVSPSFRVECQGEQGLVMPRIEINRLVKALLAPQSVSLRLVNRTHQVIGRCTWSQGLQVLLASSDGLAVSPKIGQVQSLFQ